MERRSMAVASLTAAGVMGHTCPRILHSAFITTGRVVISGDHGSPLA
jgi:hypothetical protein